MDMSVCPGSQRRNPDVSRNLRGIRRGRRQLGRAHIRRVRRAWRSRRAGRIQVVKAVVSCGGPSRDAWTVPHIHREMEESFFVLDGEFTFAVGEQEIAAGVGSYILAPRGTRHEITAGPEGGRLLTLMVPGGLEEMFFELADLPPDSVTDPAVRGAISARHDSIPQGPCCSQLNQKSLM